MGQPAPQEGESSVIVSLSEAAMHMHSAAIDALPVPEDETFHKRADVVLSGMRKLRAALTEAACRNRSSPMVIVALSDVRRRYDDLMTRAAAAAGSGLGQQLYAARIRARLSAKEVANGAGLRAELLDDLEAGEIPTQAEAARVKSLIAALGGVPGAENRQHQEPTESPVNGWDGSFDSDTVGEAPDLAYRFHRNEPR